MKNHGIVTKNIVFFIIMAVLSSSAFAISEDAKKAGSDLNGIEKDMGALLDSGLPIIRYNDTLAFATQIYEAQIALENASGKADYSLVQEKIKELRALKQNALRASDELKVLEMTINQTKGIDLAPVIEIYGEARNEFNSERYEESIKLIDTAYKKISELEAVETKIKAIYDAGSRNIMGFLNERWKDIALAALAVAIIYLLTHTTVSAWFIKRKIRSLEMRRNSIKGLLSKAQKAYFEERSLGETSYYVRTKKYGELIRDINRQIPLLKEELAKKQKRRYLENLVAKQAGVRNKSSSTDTHMPVIEPYNFSKQLEEIKDFIDN